MVIAEDVAGDCPVEALAQRIVEAFRVPSAGEEEVVVGASVGMAAAVPGEDMTPECLRPPPADVPASV